MDDTPLDNRQATQEPRRPAVSQEESRAAAIRAYDQQQRQRLEEIVRTQLAHSEDFAGLLRAREIEDERVKKLIADDIAKRISEKGVQLHQISDLPSLIDKSSGPAYVEAEKQERNQQQVPQQPNLVQESENLQSGPQQAPQQEPAPVQGPDRYAPLTETHEQVARETTQEQSARLDRLLDDMARNPAHYEADLSRYEPLNDTHQEVAVQPQPSEPALSRADREAVDAEHAASGDREMTEARQVKLGQILEGMANDDTNTNAHSHEQATGHSRGGTSE